MSLWTRDRDKTDRGERGNRREGGGVIWSVGVWHNYLQISAGT